MLKKWLLIAFTITVASSVCFAHVRNIPLSVGLIHDEFLPDMPLHFRLAGTFGRYVRLEYNRTTKTLRIIPKYPGFGTLEIFNTYNNLPVYRFTVDVRRTNLQDVARQIKYLLREIDGVKIEIVNHKVVVDGEILLPSDMERIHDVVRQFPGLAASLARLSPEAQVKIAQFIERAINDPQIHVKAVNGKYLLTGVAQSQKEKDRAVILAKTYVPDVVVDQAVADKKVQKRVSQVVIDLITVAKPPPAQPGKTIQVIVHYVELQKDYTKGFRFQWTPDLGQNSAINFTTGQPTSSGTTTPGLTSVITGTITNLIPKLNWAKEHGHARDLESTSMIVEDGKQGEINDVTNVPYQSVTTGTGGALQSTNFAKIGITTKVTPKIIGAESDSVELNLQFTVSNLISNTQAGPMFSTDTVNTEVVVQSGQSAAIGGLVRSTNNTAFNREPAGADPNPILSLYASKDFNSNQSQFVVFVTPVIKSSASSGSRRIIHRFQLRE